MTRSKAVVIEEKDKVPSNPLPGTKAEIDLQSLRDIRQSRSVDREINNFQEEMDQDTTDVQNTQYSRQNDKQSEDEHNHNNKMENLDNEGGINENSDGDNEK